MFQQKILKRGIESLRLNTIQIEIQMTTFFLLKFFEFSLQIDDKTYDHTN